jgi:hypothetical protein
VAGKPQPFDPVTIEPAIFALMGGKPAPQQRAALLRVAQAAQRQRQRETHGGRLVAMGAGRNVMKPCPLQPLLGQVTVDLGKAQEPRRAFPARALELRMALLGPQDMRAQGLDQGRGVAALTKRGGAGASFPAPRTMMCRSCTHDCDDPECSYFVP